MSNQRVYSAQPLPTGGMVVAPGGGGNRNANNMPVDSEGRDWSHGKCDCFDDCSTCILATFVPCIVYGQNKHRYHHLHTQGTPHPEHGGCCSGACCGHAVTSLCGMSFLLQMTSRGYVRHRYNIKGGGCRDCCTSLWCQPCALVQESRELELEEHSFISQRY